MKDEIIKVLQTWKALRRWQNTGDDGTGNRCAAVVFDAHAEALSGLESLLQPEETANIECEKCYTFKPHWNYCASCGRKFKGFKS